ncbi:MAG TPA: hypothetical protein VK152_12360 [Paludibacter sp.]|nr:hypothetical protein [Paludibacter sp.]
MKRFIQALQVAVFLMLLPVSMPAQAGTITGGLSATPAMIDIGANSKVRFTYTADIAPFGQQVLVFLERDANGMITQNIVGSFSGYGSGTCCTTLATGKAAIVFSSYTSGGTYEIQYCADSPLAVNGDLGVAGNENVYGKLTVMDKLGIGTSTPATSLHVVGNPLGMTPGDYTPLTKVQSLVYGNQLYVNDYTVREPNGGGSWQTASYLRGISIDNSYNTPATLLTWIKQRPAAAKIEFGSSGTTFMSVGSSVGIGTTAPSNNFEVVNSNSGTLDIAGFYNTYAYGNSSKAETRINLGKIENNTTRQPMGAIGAFPTSNYDSSNGNLAFYTRNTQNMVERLRINKDGKVGIGLTNPDNTFSNTPAEELLIVNGTIHASEVKVNLEGLADYVFSPSYTLMPLHKVEEYVKANSHLPEIPSASEVKENGLSMGEMQNKLLQKIEELTLYMIDQQKTIAGQQKRIEQLEKQLQGK